MKKSLLLLLVLLAGCSSPSVRVIERSGDRPDWVDTAKMAYQKDGKQYFIGYVSVEGDSSPSAAMNLADSKSYAEPMTAITDDFFEQSQLGESLKETTGKRMISSLRKSKISLPGIQVTSRYWERKAIPMGSSAPDKIELHVYSLAEMPVHEYESAKAAAVQKLKGDPEIKKELDLIGKEQRDRAYQSGQTPAAK